MASARMASISWFTRLWRGGVHALVCLFCHCFHSVFVHLFLLLPALPPPMTLPEDAFHAMCSWRHKQTKGAPATRCHFRA